MAVRSIRCSPARVRRFRKIDHASIYLLIAGTYTPLCFNLFSGFWRWGMLAVIWIVAILGMIGKAFYISRSDWFFVSIYLGAGWISVLAVGEVWHLFVAGAAFCHFMLMLQYVLPFPRAI